MQKEPFFRGRASSGAALAGVVLLSALLVPGAAAPEHQHSPPTDPEAIALSADLEALLSEEMLAIEAGIGVLFKAMSAGEWPVAAETAERIEKSYILAQRLTPEQLHELERVLPPRFKALDSAFHGSAGKLSRAARERDAELAGFHAYKLMEACIECHGAYARERFPGFEKKPDAHEHH